MYTQRVAGRSPDADFEWDAENIAHLARHRIEAAEVEEIFRNDPAIIDHDVVEAEDRWTTVGVTRTMRVLVAVFTVRRERIRVITGWDADKRTKKEYFKRSGAS